jgi:hypothetical protein
VIDAQSPDCHGNDYKICRVDEHLRFINSLNMGPLDVFIHLLSFLAPALAVAMLVALAGRLFLARQPQGRSWWSQAAMNFIAGTLGLGAGLWYFGVDGKMAAYGALVVVVASCQWACGRAWRG